MQWLLLVDSHLLGFLERYRHEPCHPAVAELFAENERAELRRIEDYYFRAGEKRARMRYVAGHGHLRRRARRRRRRRDRARALALRQLSTSTRRAIQEFYAAAAAGGVGAMISVLMRMSGRGSFAIDHELSRWEVMLVGAYRPLIGSVSGIVVYFLVQTPLIPIEQTRADAAVLRRGRVPRGLQRAVDEGRALGRDAHDRRARRPAERAGAAAAATASDVATLEPERRARPTAPVHPGERRAGLRDELAREDHRVLPQRAAIRDTGRPHRQGCAAVQAFVLSLRSEGGAPR